MSYFTSEYNSFFKELAAHNYKEWFHENKKRYETHVKKPFEAFVGDLTERMKAEGAKIEAQPKDMIFRINRDIRFSKDKSPYKLNRSAICSRYGRKDKSYPGLYLDFGPEKLWIGGGAYFLSKEQLYDVRERIAKKPGEFKAALEDPAFTATYGTIQGDKNKILPKEFKSTLETIPEIANKQFYYMSEHAPGELLEDNLVEKCIAHWKAAQKIESFLIKGMIR